MQQTICIVGIGYVGLPLAVAFAKLTNVIGFDVNAEKICELKKGNDPTKTISEKEFKDASIFFTNDPAEIKKADFIIIAVPTPVDNAKHPDISHLESASRIVGKNLKRDAIVIYESTVYPGLTETICLPILEKESGMKIGEFGLGYSPERINPGDKEHQLHNTMKIVSGHDIETREKIAVLYEKIVTVGVYRAPSIKVAEAAKVVENVQRDMNIALTNELALIFNKLHIDTKEVLDAAATKWNFHKYYPGLVGGHCIATDPHYLAHQAIQQGYHPKLILSGREINDYMARHIGDMVVKELNNQGKALKNTTVILMGLTFKENVTDFRNTRAGDIIIYLKEYGICVVACEPNLPSSIVEEHFNVSAVDCLSLPPAEAILVINKHTQFTSISLEKLKQQTNASLLVDIKRLFSKEQAEKLGFVYKTL